MPEAMPSYYNWNYSMPSLGPNGELVGGPDPYADQADPSKGTDIRRVDGSWMHLDPHKDRNGNYISPTTFLSDSLPGGDAYAFPDTDEYGHIGRVFRTDRNRAIGKMLAIAGAGALAAGAGGAGAAGGVGDVGSLGEGISEGFLSPATEAAMSGAGAGAAVPLGADIMTVTAPALGGGLGAAGTAGLVGGATAALASGAGSAGLAPSGLPSGVTEGMASPETAVASGTETAAPSGGGIFSQIGNSLKGSLYNPDGTINWLNAAKMGGGALSSLGSMAGAGAAQTTPTMPVGWNDPAKYQSMSRSRAPAMADADYATYGTKGGEHKFFTDPVYTAKADGGHVRGPGSGRSDDIEARLSDGEYVFDAESVALLGDGSIDEGSRRLDQLRANIRKHKGVALAKGKFSPAAKDPMHYMGKAKGGAVARELPSIDVAGRNRQLLADRLTAIHQRQSRPDLSTMPPEDRDSYMQFIERLKNLAPPQKAKGGRMRVIPGGVTADPAMRLAQLENAQRTAAALRSQPELTPPSVAIQGDRAMVDAARQRLLRIRSLADSTPPPVAKAEGGAVKDLTEFADRLEEATPELPVLAE